MTSSNHSAFCSQVVFPPLMAGNAASTVKHWQLKVQLSTSFKYIALVISLLSYTHFSISGAQWTNSWFQNLNAGFFISSMKVMRRPQGWGLFTISRSKRTLQSKNKTEQKGLKKNKERKQETKCMQVKCIPSHLVICSWIASVLASANR